MRVTCGRSGVTCLGGICKGADVASVFSLCGPGGLGNVIGAAPWPSCCNGAGGGWVYGASCVGGLCLRSGTKSARLAKWRPMSCATFQWKVASYFNHEDAPPFLFLCLCPVLVLGGIESGGGTLLSPS